MTTVTVTVLDTPTTAAGLEWGLAIGHVPALDTAEARRFLADHAAADNAGTDVYALVTPEELWTPDLSGLPCLELDVPADQAAALVCALAADE